MKQVTTELVTDYIDAIMDDDATHKLHCFMLWCVRAKLNK